MAKLSLINCKLDEIEESRRRALARLTNLVETREKIYKHRPAVDKATHIPVKEAKVDGVARPPLLAEQVAPMWWEKYDMTLWFSYAFLTLFFSVVIVILTAVYAA